MLAILVAQGNYRGPYLTPADLKVTKVPCDSCSKAKLKNVSFKGTTKRNVTPGDIWNVDCFGQVNIPSIDGHVYGFVMVEEAVGYATCWLILDTLAVCLIRTASYIYIYIHMYYVR